MNKTKQKPKMKTVSYNEIHFNCFLYLNLYFISVIVFPRRIDLHRQFRFARACKSCFIVCYAYVDHMRMINSADSVNLCDSRNKHE